MGGSRDRLDDEVVRGRSQEQEADYDGDLASLASLLAAAPMTVTEIVAAIEGTPSACCRVSVYGRIRVLEERGFPVKRRKRREKVPGKSGSRERVFWIDVEEK